MEAKQASISGIASRHCTCTCSLARHVTHRCLLHRHTDDPCIHTMSLNNEKRNMLHPSFCLTRHASHRCLLHLHTDDPCIRDESQQRTDAGRNFYPEPRKETCFPQASVSTRTPCFPPVTSESPWTVPFISDESQQRNLSLTETSIAPLCLTQAGIEKRNMAKTLQRYVRFGPFPPLSTRRFLRLPSCLHERFHGLKGRDKASSNWNTHNRCPRQPPIRQRARDRA